MSPTYVRRVTGIDWGVEAGHNPNRQYTNHSGKIDSRKWASTYVYLIPVTYVYLIPVEHLCLPHTNHSGKNRQYTNHFRVRPGSGRALMSTSYQSSIPVEWHDTQNKGGRQLCMTHTCMCTCMCIWGGYD